MLAGRQFETRLGLTSAKMKVVLVLRDRLVGIERFIDIDKQMMMSAVRIIIAGMGDAHVAQSKTTPEAALDDSAVLRPDKAKKRVLGRRLSLRLCGIRERQKHCCQRNGRDDPHERAPRKPSGRESNPESMCRISNVGGGVVAILRPHINQDVLPGPGPDDMRSAVGLDPC